jgi:hypothetical protein
MQTTSFELSKKLDKFKIHHKSYFWWCFGISNCPKTAYIATENEIMNADGLTCKPKYKAYTLDEILEMLPDCIMKEPKEYRLFMISYIQKSTSKKIYRFVYNIIDDILRTANHFDHKNPAEAAGQLLLWCVENGYVEVGAETTNSLEADAFEDAISICRICGEGIEPRIVYRQGEHSYCPKCFPQVEWR